MTERKVEVITEPTEHSFEKVLGVPSGTTEMTQIVVKSKTDPHELYDKKDDEIEEDFLNIYDKALEMFERLMIEIDDVDQSKRSRLAEVANQTLNTALTAAKERRGLKEHIDVLSQKERAISKKASSGKITNNNLFVGSHAQLLDALAGKVEDEKIIDIEKTTDSDESDN